MSNKKNTPSEPHPYKFSQAEVDTRNPAELVTAVTMVLAKQEVNFDALYGSLSFYFSSAEYPTLGGMRAAIMQGAAVGRDYDSDVLLPDDIFN